MLDSVSVLVTQAGDIPGQALQFAAMQAAHWQRHSSTQWPVCMITALSPSAAVNSLPYTLPALMQHKAWQSTAEPCTRHLIKLVLPAATNAGKDAGQTQADQTVKQIAAACFVAMKEHLANDSWQHMPHVLASMQ